MDHPMFVDPGSVMPAQDEPIVKCVPVVKMPNKVHDSRPPWPELRVQTHGGTLFYEITIGPSGDVTDVRQIRRGRSAGVSNIIADAWARAIREWRFEPTVVDGRPTPVCMTVSVTIDV